MSLQIVFRREAEREYADAAAWYEEELEGLRTVFTARVESTLQQIAELPTLYAKIYGDARRAIVRQFPYSVIYRVEADRVLVLAVIHTSRDPAIWQARV